jgi:hypothetical protein
VFDPIRRLQRSTTRALAFSPVGIILISATRVLIVSDYKVSTATAIVASGGYANTLLGSLLPVVPLVFPYLALLLLFSRRFIVGLLALAAAVLVSPLAYSRTQALRLLRANGSHAWDWMIGAPLILVLAAVVAVLVLFTAIFGAAEVPRIVGLLLAVAMVPLVLVLYPLPVGASSYAQLVRQPWMPEERFTLAARPPVLGYVLSDTNVSMEVLVQSDRSVVFYPNKLVLAQVICQPVAGSLRPLLPLTAQRNPAPPCVQRKKANQPAHAEVLRSNNWKPARQS